MQERERERERERETDRQSESGGGDTQYISMCRDVLTKEVLFSESVWNGVGVFHCKKSGNGFKYNCLERGPCLSGKGYVNYLILEFYFR